MIKNKIKQLLFIIPFICFCLGYAVFSYIFYSTKVTVPSLIGKQLADCTAVLAKNKLSIRFLSEQEQEHLPEGTIIEQIPKQGQLIRPQQQILVITTKKPEPLKTPNFFGLSQEAIAEQAQELKLAATYIDVPSQKNQKTCCAQCPAPQETLPNKAVTIFIAKNKEELFLMPNLYGTTVQEAAQLLHKKSCKLQAFYNHQSVPLEYCQQSKISNQAPAQGSIISLKNPLVVQVEIS